MESTSTTIYQGGSDYKTVSLVVDVKVKTGKGNVVEIEADNE